MGDTNTERDDFINALGEYHKDILKLQNINIDEPEENTLDTKINDFYNQYKTNYDGDGDGDGDIKTLPESIDYIKNPDKLDNEGRKNIIDSSTGKKLIIETYIDKHIKPTNNQNTKTLKFEVPDVNTKIDTDKKLYYIYQNLLKLESNTKKIGMNAINWGYFGIITNGLSALFQMYTLYKTKSAKSFSMPFIWIMTFLNAVYCLVGILEKNIGLAVATFFFVVYNFTVIYVYYKYN